MMKFTFLCFISLLLGCHQKVSHETSTLYMFKSFEFNDKEASYENDSLTIFSNTDVIIHFKVKQMGRYKLALKVRGTPAKNIWPEFKLLLNGNDIGSAAANSILFSDKTFETTVTSFNNDLVIQFRNAGFDEMTNRNRDLNIQLVRIEYIQKR